MTYLAVLPSVWQPYTEACLASMHPDLRGATVVVDNRRRNLGVAASWNVGARAVLAYEADWLVVVSAAVRFEQHGGMDFVDQLAEHPQAVAVEGAWGLGWHLIAFHRRALEQVGLFDERFWPGYFEDNDYSWRLVCAGLAAGPPPWWPKVTVEAYVRCFAHAERFAGVRADAPALLAYYERKWGGPPGGERHRAPFDGRPG